MPPKTKKKGKYPREIFFAVSLKTFLLNYVAGEQNGLKLKHAQIVSLSVPFPSLRYIVLLSVPFPPLR